MRGLYEVHRYDVSRNLCKSDVKTMIEKLEFLNISCMNRGVGSHQQTNR
jgi:hypothetical protein